MAAALLALLVIIDRPFSRITIADGHATRTYELHAAFAETARIGWIAEWPYGNDFLAMTAGKGISLFRPCDRIIYHEIAARSQHFQGTMVIRKDVPVFARNISGKLPSMTESFPSLRFTFNAAEPKTH